jgi:ZIP family zinc transporter
MFAAIFLSNLPEGLSSALGMRRAGRSATYIFGLWIGIAVLSGLAALAGAAFLGGASPQLLAAVNAVAAGALLTMVINTMSLKQWKEITRLLEFWVCLGF